MEKIVIDFEGDRDATAPLTWAQKRTWKGTQYKYRIVQAVPIPPGKTVQEVCSAIKWAYEEFESLRTTYPVGNDGAPCQKVIRAGSVEIDIVRAGELTLEDDVQAAVSRFGKELHDIRRDISAVFAVVTAGGAPTHLIHMASHLALDCQGAIALNSAIKSYLMGQYVRATDPVFQPVDRARWEQSEIGIRENSRALAYWKEVLEKFPSCSSRSGIMTSPALASAASQIAEKCRVSTSAVYLAALGLVAGALTQRTTCSFLSAFANRKTVKEQSFVGELVQNAGGLLESLDESFETVVRKAWRSSLTAYTFSSFDEQELLDMHQRMDEDRNLDKRVFDIAFNDGRGSRKSNAPLPAVHDVLSRTVVTEGEEHYRGDGRFFSCSLQDADIERITIIIHDFYFPGLSARRVLLAIEALIVGVAMADIECVERPILAVQGHLES
ncbi:condensation domain-containing protein [Streptomyces sp. NPDC005402]|uniref:condensation domain-containing protein n=1 Tax=Streptomyces sp. NPDC005402 TaxID=3155338 RepID=UPI0033ADB493